MRNATVSSTGSRIVIANPAARTTSTPASVAIARTSVAPTLRARPRWRRRHRRVRGPAAASIRTQNTGRSSTPARANTGCATQRIPASRARARSSGSSPTKTQLIRGHARRGNRLVEDRSGRLEPQRSSAGSVNTSSNIAANAAAARRRSASVGPGLDRMPNRSCERRRATPEPAGAAGRSAPRPERYSHPRECLRYRRIRPP